MDGTHEHVVGLAWLSYRNILDIFAHVQHLLLISTRFVQKTATYHPSTIFDVSKGALTVGSNVNRVNCWFLPLQYTYLETCVPPQKYIVWNPRNSFESPPDDVTIRWLHIQVKQPWCRLFHMHLCFVSMFMIGVTPNRQVFDTFRDTIITPWAGSHANKAVRWIPQRRETILKVSVLR